MWVSLFQFEEPVRLDIGHRTQPLGGLESAQKSMTNQARIDAIYRYPVKGLSPQRLARVTLSAGATLPADRLYAIENGPSGFDPARARLFPQAALPDADAQ